MWRSWACSASFPGRDDCWAVQPRQDWPLSDARPIRGVHQRLATNGVCSLEQPLHRELYGGRVGATGRGDGHWVVRHVLKHGRSWNAYYEGASGGAADGSLYGPRFGLEQSRKTYQRPSGTIGYELIAAGTLILGMARLANPATADFHRTSRAA